MQWDEKRNQKSSKSTMGTYCVSCKNQYCKKKF